MTSTDRSEPRPRAAEWPSEHGQYHVIRRTYLPVPDRPAPRPFFDVVDARVTRRSFGTVGLEALSALLWFTAKTRQVTTLPSGVHWQHRPVPSAGGRHPIDLLVVQPLAGRWVVSVYDELAHALCELQVDAPAVTALVEAVTGVVDPEQGTMLWQAAHPRRTLAKYQHGESLVWRDSGVLLGHLALVCEALHLNCCPIGITGHEQVKGMLKRLDVAGTGGCILGSRTEAPASGGG